MAFMEAQRFEMLYALVAGIQFVTYSVNTGDVLTCEPRGNQCAAAFNFDAQTLCAYGVRFLRGRIADAGTVRCRYLLTHCGGAAYALPRRLDR